MARGIDRTRLLDATLPAAVRERRALALDLLDAGLAAVEPRAATLRGIEAARAAGIELDGCTLFAFGKAARGMAEAALSRLRVKQGIVLGPDNPRASPRRAKRDASGCSRGGEPPRGEPEWTESSFAGRSPRRTTVRAKRGAPEGRNALRRGRAGGWNTGEGPLAMYRAGHPLPSPDAPERGAEVLALARSLGAGDVALCLVSGGGSAMLELPRQGVALGSIATTTRLLNEAGASIAELNAVRCCLSQLKGGRLAAALAPARVVNVLISDVPGDDLSVIASGPSVPPPAGAPDARGVLERYALRDRVPADALRAIDAPEPVAGVAVQSFLAADNATARRTILARASELGLCAAERELAGIARDAGPALYADALERFAADPALGAIVAGGETTVRVRGSGRGGRNQELALAVLAVFRGGLLATLGTDGIDGASDAAGALVDEITVLEAARRRLDPARFLADNDSHRFFAELGTQLRTGPTGTNVADLCLVLR